jgi:hypothetical protein
MPTIIPKYWCKYCDQRKHNKDAFERHIISCKWIHTSVKDRELQEATVPSQQVMLQMILDLTEKYQQLEKKMERIQANQTTQTRKSMLDYLKSLPAIKTTFTKWIEGIQVGKQHLKILFDDNIIQSVNKIIMDAITIGIKDALPMRNYTQKAHQIYIYDVSTKCENVFEWRQMDSQDWKRLMKQCTKKIKLLYFEWKRGNQDEIDRNEKMGEFNNIYRQKINHIDDISSIQIGKIKQNIIKHIQCNITF